MNQANHIECSQLGFTIAHIDDDGYYGVQTGGAPIAVEQLRSGHYGVVLWSRSYPELLRRIDLLAPALPLLRQAGDELEAGRTEPAGMALAGLRSSAARLREVMIDAYHRCPRASDLQFYLGLTCLAAGEEPEGMFHLLRSIPYQDAWFGIGGDVERLRYRPDIAGRLLAIVTAFQWAGREEQAAELIRVFRAAMRRFEIGATCARFGGNVLWSHPEIIERTRGIIQVGANIGDELHSFASLGIATLLAFEPVPSAYQELLRNIAAHRREGFDWRACQLAVADEVGDLEFWQGQESGNSSFLELNPERSAHHSGNVHDRRITVQTTTLDRFFAESPLAVTDYNMIFMDVQGVEHKVLRGARETLRHVDYVCLEVSYTEIYSGSLLADEMEVCFNELGFEKYAEAPGCFAEQADAIYIRRDLWQPPGAGVGRRADQRVGGLWVL